MKISIRIALESYVSHVWTEMFMEGVTTRWWFLLQVLECNNIVQAMNILEGLIPGEDAPKAADASHLEKLFVFSLMWSIGALLELDDRKKVLNSLFNLIHLNLRRTKIHLGKKDEEK